MTPLFPPPFQGGAGVGDAKPAPNHRRIHSNRYLAALAATPLLALLTLATTQIANDAHLTAPTPTPYVTDRNGAYLTQSPHLEANRKEYGYWPTTPPPRVLAATIALEDRRFYSHPGVDPIALLRALIHNVTGTQRSGASTIAMQVARLQHPRPRTLWSKTIEAGTALALTARYGRAAILAQYLRLAPYANGSHGIAHAARYYFDKPAPDLTWPEAALLSAIPQAPALANPNHQEGLARARRRAARALAALNLPEPETQQAQQDLANLTPHPAPHRPLEAMHAVLRLEHLARIIPVDPANPILKSTLDVHLQSTITKQLRTHLAAWRDAGAQQGAVLLIRRTTGEVLADVASAGWRTHPGGAVDYTAALRSPGSTLKPFLYALALDRGRLAPSDVMEDSPEGASGIENADNAYLGPLLPRQALANSRNIPAATLLARIGLQTGYDFLRTAGLHHSPAPADRYGLGLAIGALPTRLDWLVQAYRALATDGQLTGLQWLQNQPPPSPHRLVTQATARLIANFLSDPMARLPSFPRYGPSEYPFTVALKTGTSQQYRDSWTIAWSADYLIGVWIGRPDAGPMEGLSGARAAARLTQSILLGLHNATRTDLIAGAFPAPSGLAPSELCTATGRPGPCSQHLTEWTPPTPASPVPSQEPHLSIIDPQPNAHIWRNPDAPPALQRLVLRASVTPPVPQIAWLVDGEVVALTPPDRPFHWPMQPGQHRFQLRLPLQSTVSRQLKIIIE